MDEQTKIPPMTLAAPGPKEEELAPQVWMMVKTFWESSGRNRLFLLGTGIFAVVSLTAYAQIELNAWNKPFYDALSLKNFGEFMYQLLVFAVIAGALLTLNVAQAWLREMSKLRLREGLTHDLFDQWLVPKRAFRLSNAGEIGENPDQRIHEDARHLVDLSTDLGIGLLQATLLLVSFITVLWAVSDDITFTIGGLQFGFPGYMVWFALIYAGIASFASWRVGRPLIPLNAHRYAREADLRFSLVRVNERTEAITLYGGEVDEKDFLNREFRQVLSMMRRLVTGITRLTWVTAGYGWFAIVAPFIVAAPGYFAGDMSLGGLMMAVGAFNQVQQALRWFVDNFSLIADWRATLLRVASFRLALTQMDKLGREAGRIDVLPTIDDRIVFDHVGISSPDGCARLSEKHVVINPAERVVIIGKRRGANTSFFSAVAGLWPWGDGRILLPPPQSMMFISQQDYIPPGALRSALAYPSPPSQFSNEEYISVLERMELTDLAPALDRVARWERELARDEQDKLDFARLLLRKPRWILLEGIDHLEEDTRSLVLDIFGQELAEAAIVNIGAAHTYGGFFTRVLHLIDDPEGQRLKPSVQSPVALPPAKEKAPAV
ncbi:MAG: ABC transporter ATP-binding protein/permease [Beijerinckiaceae bacterium]|nr:ABC transporter ATP-binding protein/permease [Beijerinckiaceae bacterium]MCI0736598.1 ABC transporter ATP-binding protein/permease [Beijerinckiaceae bacterium]